MAYWLIKDYSLSLNTLLEVSSESDAKVVKDFNCETAPAVFNYYIFLRSHPPLVKHQTVASNGAKVGNFFFLFVT